jgi:hypothetical protein
MVEVDAAIDLCADSDRIANMLAELLYFYFFLGKGRGGQ